MADALPVAVLDRDDRVELPAGATPTVLRPHPALGPVENRWPVLLGLNEVVARAESLTLAECAGYPLVVVGEYGRGRSAAFTSDVAPHWAPPEFLAWSGYHTLWDNLIHWLAGEN